MKLTGKYTIAFFSALAMTWAVMAAPARAETPRQEGAFPWQNGDHDQMRVLWRETGNGKWRLALHIRLDEGWKTYWRLAGDSGIDPQLDLSASSPHKLSTIFWPRPTAFDEGGGYWSFGYKDELILPFDLQFTADQQQLRLRVDYGVCESICLPESKSFDLHLPGPEKRVGRYIANARNALPGKEQSLPGIRRVEHRLFLPRQDTDGRQAILELEGSALIAQAAGNEWQVDLPPGKRANGIAARLWLIEADDYHAKSLTIP